MRAALSGPARLRYYAQADGGYRVATSLWYLVDTESGGETTFPGAPLFLLPAKPPFRLGLSISPLCFRDLTALVISPPPSRADSEWADPALAAGSWSDCAQDRVSSRAKKGCGTPHERHPSERKDSRASSLAHTQPLGTHQTEPLAAVARALLLR